MPSRPSVISVDPDAAAVFARVEHMLDVAPCVGVDPRTSQASDIPSSSNEKEREGMAAPQHDELDGLIASDIEVLCGAIKTLTRVIDGMGEVRGDRLAAIVDRDSSRLAMPIIQSPPWERSSKGAAS